MTELNFNSIVDMVAQSFFAGDTNVASLVIMLAVCLVFVVILANIQAPPVYAVVPLIPLAVVFHALGVMELNLAMLIIVVASVVTAVYARGIVTGR